MYSMDKIHTLSTHTPFLSSPQADARTATHSHTQSRTHTDAINHCSAPPLPVADGLTHICSYTSVPVNFCQV